MISDFYIESAKNIRNQFINLSGQLDKYQGELKKISKLLLDTAKELENYIRSLPEFNAEIFKAVTNKFDFHLIPYLLS